MVHRFEGWGSGCADLRFLAGLRFRVVRGLGAYSPPGLDRTGGIWGP